jgi:pimeloyl-ACP methyl ester carboxylesterase
MTTSMDTHETASTKLVQVENGSLQFAYRRFGRLSGGPLVLVNYFAANMDDWDPKVTNGLAANREVILFDYAGVGASTGATPSTVAALTKDLAAFCRALDLKTVDVAGFSLGGMVAQEFALNYPGMIRRLILLGTGPRGGESMTFAELSLDELTDPVALLMNAFFTQSEASQAAGRAYVERLKLRVADREPSVTKEAAAAQLEAIREWGGVPAKDRYATLGQIYHPTLIVHGSKDIVVAPINAFLLEQHLPNAQLVMFPDANHASQSQHADVFLEYAQLFLKG